MGEMKTAKDLVAQEKARVENLTPAQVSTGSTTSGRRKQVAVSFRVRRQIALTVAGLCDHIMVDL